MNLPEDLSSISIENSIPAGFPSPAEDHMDPALNVGNLLVKNPNSTFYFRSKLDRPLLKIDAGDILIVDRSLTPKDADTVIFTKNYFSIA